MMSDENNLPLKTRKKGRKKKSTERKEKEKKGGKFRR